MPLRPLRRLVGPLAVVISVSLLAGCGGDAPTPEAEATSTPSEPTTSPTDAASPPTPVEPEIVAPVVPAYAKGKIGQEDFARFVVQAWSYSLAANDASPLLEVSAGERPCAGCKELVTTLDGRIEEGWSVYPFEVPIDEIRLSGAADVITATVGIDIPETRVYFDDGSFRNSNPAREDRSFTVTMRPEVSVTGKGKNAVRETSYRLIGFSIS